MSRRSQVDSHLAALDELLGSLSLAAPISEAIERFRATSAAARFHLQPRKQRPPIVAVLGGTGTGKSTIVNRLLGANVTAASFRRTFTAGPIAIVKSADALPDAFLRIPHEATLNLPARGEADKLAVIEQPHDLAGRITLLDTPDLDGDQPAHHAQADRVFRWAQAAIFIVTPEKYQMNELLPYYRLANRYALAALFVMNKTEHAEAVADYAQMLAGQSHPDARVFAIPRDDSHFQPASDADLQALRSAAGSLGEMDPSRREEGLSNRLADLLDRLHDQVLGPLSHDRAQADRTIEHLRAMEAPAAGVDVNPVTRALARRLQERSILYLIGPQRILDRVRQVPGLLVRLPRTAWDLVMTGKADLAALGAETESRKVPDFHAAMVDQFNILQTRIDDVLTSTPTLPFPGIPGEGQGRGALRTAQQPPAWRLDVSRAGVIADEELADLNGWLEKRWNATPRDTAILMKFIRHLPGGEKLTRWSEAAPYLLTIIVAAHHVAFGHIDLMILGGYSLATWLTERLSNEVASRTRLANRRIADRFQQLAHEQIEAACSWIDARAASHQAINKLRKLAESLMP